MAIQVAAFKDKKFADELVERFKNKGYSAYTVSGKSPGKATWYKVRIGLFNDRAEAQSTVNKLRKYKKKAIIIVNETADSAKKKQASVAKVEEDR
ncbi:MAG: SPOR domain-containing protein, partial [Desulfobulbaceae bacterium]|nr:SPOR domain-containing protein [Desulfobulbaceae bacterium]